jgi:23S rRNA (cytidine2498-2'-O)-methyltransferase
MNAMIEQPRFIFVGCQVGAESALKEELARSWPDLRFAFSRPGFLTFKRTSDDPFPEDFDLKSIFARCHGFSIGRVEAGPSEVLPLPALAKAAWGKIESLPVRRWHVWQRDAAAPGEHGFEPGETDLARSAIRALLGARPAGAPELTFNELARPGELVADCVLVEPREWWIGYHRAASVAARWPGGIPRLIRPENMISRAYLKMNEALEWSRLPIRREDTCLEIGSSPGGAAQALLDRGYSVIGVDPAVIDDRLLARERFTHVRKHAEDMKRKEFQEVDWLFADSNVAPETTLAIVEGIVGHWKTNIRGLLLTIKLLDWELAARAPEYLDRVRSWGYEYVRARQLAFNRQEFCIAALKSRALRRPSRVRLRAARKTS